MNTQDKPLVEDAVFGSKRKTVWRQDGQWVCRFGGQLIAVELVRPGEFRTVGMPFFAPHTGPKPVEPDEFIPPAGYHDAIRMARMQARLAAA